MSPILQSLGNADLRAFGWSRSSAGGSSSAMTLISTQILASVTSTVIFNSIPGTYKHLQLRIAALDANGGILTAIFNGDTTTSYALHYLQGSGSMVSGQSNTRANFWVGQGTGAASIPGVSIVDILDYASTAKYKTARVFQGMHQGSTNYVIGLQSGLWMNTAAITSITIGDLAGNINANTRISLYGVAG
jgi:hypothetical protein